MEIESNKDDYGRVAIATDCVCSVTVLQLMVASTWRKTALGLKMGDVTEYNVRQAFCLSSKKVAAKS